MRNSAATLSFRFWIGLTRQILFAVDGWRYGPPPSIPGVTTACEIASGDRVLAGLLAVPASKPTAAILIFHGIGDRIEYWTSAQRYLAERGLTSLIFHYSGYSTSTGATTPENLRGDAHAAYRYLRAKADPALPIFLLGFSLGSGLAVEAAQTLEPPPSGVILAQPYTTLRHAAAQVVRPFRMLRYLLPDLWPTVDTVRQRSYPLLVVHGDRDELFPVAMARAIHQAASSDTQWPAHLSIPSGYSHNAMYLNVLPTYWQPILEFVARYTSSPR